MCRDQGRAHASIKADFFIDGTAIGLEGARMTPLGFTEHRSDELVEPVDGLIGQTGADVERDGGQSRMAALTFVFGDMPRRGAASLADELSEASLMHTMSMCRIEANRPDMVQTLDQPEHCTRLRRFGHLPEPGKPALVGFIPSAQ